MKRITISALAVLALWGSVGLNFASAQFGGLGQAPPRIRPSVSPYINMGTGGAGAYYGIVRPQMNTNQSLTDLQQGVLRLNPDGSLKGQLDLLNPIAAQTGLQTGHAVSFLNTGHYFPNGVPGATGSAAPPSLTQGFGGLNRDNTGFGLGLGVGIGDNVDRPLISTDVNRPLIRR